MQIEILTGEEARLIDPEGVQWPPDSVVALAREGDEVIGRQGMIELPHLEGCWVREDKRGTRLAAQLVATMEETLKTFGRSHVFAFVHDGDEHVAAYLERFGYARFPVTVYAKALAVEKQEAA